MPGLALDWLGLGTVSLETSSQFAWFVLVFCPLRLINLHTVDGLANSGACFAWTSSWVGGSFGAALDKRRRQGSWTVPGVISHLHAYQENSMQVARPRARAWPDAILHVLIVLLLLLARSLAR